jgi:hypothetical protein
MYLLSVPSHSAATSVVFQGAKDELLFPPFSRCAVAGANFDLAPLLSRLFSLDGGLDEPWPASGRAQGPKPGKEQQQPIGWN